MYRITRTAELKTASYMPKAIGFSKELVDYVNNTYPGFELSMGVEMFGAGRIHWWWQTDSLDTLQEANAKLLGDQKYWGMLETANEFWVEGSLQDTIAMVVD
jgi:hypothetical protein